MKHETAFSRSLPRSVFLSADAVQAKVNVQLQFIFLVANKRLNISFLYARK